MPPRPSDLSATLQRAARHELERLRAHAQRVQQRLDDLDAERRKLRSELARLRERAQVLEQIAEPSELWAIPASDDVVLSGSRLREEAARILATEVGLDRPIHYRDWYELVRRAGFVVLGKRPLATFLTGVGRSPVVKRGDEPGTYYVDQGALHELTYELEELQGELNDLEAVIAQEASPAPSLRQHRVKLLAGQRRIEGQLNEARYALGQPRSALHAA